MMVRKSLSNARAFLLGLGGCLLVPVIQAVQVVPVVPHIEAKTFILMEYQSGQVLAQNQSNRRFDPASLTKIMSSYVVGQALKSSKINTIDTVMIGNDVWLPGNQSLKGSSMMNLKPGQRVSMRELNKGMVIPSADDATIALANHVAGSQDAFVGMMNNYARLLGLKNTRFMTVHGLNADGQYSTAWDMALLGRALIHDLPEQYVLHQEKYFNFDKIRQPNGNRLLWSTQLKADGLKAGFTPDVGYNLVASAVKGGRRLIAVVIGADSDQRSVKESEKLLVWGFHSFEPTTPLKANHPFIHHRVWFGEQDEVALGVAQDAEIMIPQGTLPHLKARYTLSQALEAPLVKNQVVGSIDFQLNGKTIEQRPLVVLEAVAKGGIFSRMWDFLLLKMS